MEPPPPPPPDALLLTTTPTAVDCALVLVLLFVGAPLAFALAFAAFVESLAVERVAAQDILPLRKVVGRMRNVFAR